MKIDVQHFGNGAMIVVSADSEVRRDLSAEGWSNAREMLQGIIETTPGLDTLILDLTAADFSFNDMVALLAHIRREVAALGGKDYFDANLRVLVVGWGDLPEMIVGALAKEQYGGFDARLFATRDAALTYAGELLAAA